MQQKLLIRQMAQKYRWRERNPREYESKMAAIEPFSHDGFDVVNSFLGVDDKVDYRLSSESWE